MRGTDHLDSQTGPPRSDVAAVAASGALLATAGFLRLPWTRHAGLAAQIDLIR